jgi:hypothetical protein
VGGRKTTSPARRITALLMVLGLFLGPFSVERTGSSFIILDKKYDIRSMIGCQIPYRTYWTKISYMRK